MKSVRARKLREFADGERIATDAALAVVCERAHGEQRSRFSIRGVECGDEEAFFDFVDFVDANLRSPAQEPTKGDVGARRERRLVVVIVVASTLLSGRSRFLLPNRNAPIGTTTDQDVIQHGDAINGRAGGLSRQHHRALAALDVPYSHRAVFRRRRERLRVGEDKFNARRGLEIGVWMRPSTH